jgi:hypothetical protein
MEQKTGVSSLCAEFFQGYRVEIRLFCPAFRPNSTYKPTYMRSMASEIASACRPEFPVPGGATGLLPGNYL